MTTLREVYDKIAPTRYNLYHHTRFAPELEAMAARWKEGRLLNLGCGHGPDFLPFKANFDLYGLDFSLEMLKLANKYADKSEFQMTPLQADVSRLPFRDESFNWAISIAAYHHINSKEDRLMAFTELRRVLKPGGQAFITVWNSWQGRFLFKGKEQMVPWTVKEEKLERYYYLFSYPEIQRLAKQAGFRVLRTYPESFYHYPVKYFSRNICLWLKKD